MRAKCKETMSAAYNDTRKRVFCWVGHRVARCAVGCIRIRKPLGNLMDPKTLGVLGGRVRWWEELI